MSEEEVYPSFSVEKKEEDVEDVSRSQRTV